MANKLPGVFPGKVNKNSGNNKNFSYSKEEVNEVFSKPIVQKNIKQKLNKIFNSSNYVYKADVEITLKDKTITRRIIGKNKTHVITIDNELIPISDILDIKIKKDN